MLAKHGPWLHHVRISKSVNFVSAVEWLTKQGKKQDIDYEILIEKIEHRNTQIVQPGKTSGSKQFTNPTVKAIEPILFFNDASLASYVKLTWGGR
jgi:hypothetical protein